MLNEFHDDFEPKSPGMILRSFNDAFINASAMQSRKVKRKTADNELERLKQVEAVAYFKLPSIIRGVGIISRVTRLPGFDFRRGQITFRLATASRPALEPT